MQELKPCPFCEASAKMNNTKGGGYFIECGSCGSSTNIRYSIMDDARPLLVEAWNRRAPAIEVPVGKSFEQDFANFLSYSGLSNCSAPEMTLMRNAAKAMWSPAIDPDWQIVPKVATPDMRVKGELAKDSAPVWPWTAGVMYSAMLEAAPKYGEDGE